MWRLTAFFLALCTGLLATGLPAYLHHREHERLDAIAEAERAQARPDAPSSSPFDRNHSPAHSESDCPLCAQFHAPIIPFTASLLLLDTGQRTDDLPTPPIPQQSQSSPARISCRGPPTHIPC